MWPPQTGPPQNGPHKPLDGAGPFLPPPGYPPYQVPAHGGYPRPRPSDFREKDKVCLRIDADTWVIGIIITVVHICTKLAGGKYVVEYLSIDGSGRRERREVSNEVLMPYQPGG